MNKILVAVTALMFSVTASIASPAPLSQQVVVSGMTCGSCARAITRAFLKNPAVKDVQVDVKSGKVQLTFNEKQSMNEAQIRETVKGAGFKVESVAPVSQG
ncbi:MAG: heavy-metal-associated domain-containing protein [Oligoflexia bacterium]|jgi:copper chaperone CopZ